MQAKKIEKRYIIAINNYRKKNKTAYKDILKKKKEKKNNIVMIVIIADLLKILYFLLY